jgi:hypothetical protein
MPENCQEKDKKSINMDLRATLLNKSQNVGKT